MPDSSHLSEGPEKSLGALQAILDAERDLGQYLTNELTRRPAISIQFLLFAEPVIKGSREIMDRLYARTGKRHIFNIVEDRDGYLRRVSVIVDR